jgi:hypothetical protein
VTLRSESYNAHDCNAVVVENINGQQVGYLNRYLASAIGPTLDAYGKPLQGQVMGIRENIMGVCISVVKGFEMPGNGL